VCNRHTAHNPCFRDLRCPRLVGSSLAVDVIEYDMLGARQRGGGVHRRRHVEQRQLQVRRGRRRLLRIVLCRRQRLVVAVSPTRWRVRCQVVCKVIITLQLSLQTTASAVHRKQDWSGVRVGSWNCCCPRETKERTGPWRQPQSTLSQEGRRNLTSCAASATGRHSDEYQRQHEQPTDCSLTLTTALTLNPTPLHPD